MKKQNSLEAWQNIKSLFVTFFGEEEQYVKGVEELAKLWWENKKWMMPYFDENGKIFKELNVCSDSANWGQIEDVLYSLTSMIENILKKDKYQWIREKDDGPHFVKQHFFRVLFHYFNPAEIVDNEVKEVISINDKEIQKGTKVSKVLKEASKCFLKLYSSNGDAHNEDLSEIFLVIFSQLVSQLKTKKSTVVLSINPLDIILSSANTTGWRSCHHVLDGQYKTGPIAYTADRVSAVAYAYQKTSDFKVKGQHGSSIIIPNQPLKLWRQMVYFNESSNFAVMSREYPSYIPLYSDSAKDLAEQILKKRTSQEAVFVKQSASKFSMPAAKWSYTDSPTALVYENFDDVVPFKIGVDDLPCLCCGKIRDANQFVSSQPSFHDCGNCYGRGSHYGTCCDSCGEAINIQEESVYEVDGQIYCPSCFDDQFVYCDDCDEVVDRDFVYWVCRGRYIDRGVCERCFENDYFKCDLCENIYDADTIVLLDDGVEGKHTQSICQDCASDFSECYNCGTLVSDSYEAKDSEEAFCLSCLRECPSCFDLLYYGERDELCEECLEKKACEEKEEKNEL